MKNITREYDFNGFRIRTVEVGEKTWVVAKDVCKALGIVRTHNLTRGLEDCQKSFATVLTEHHGGLQKMSVVSFSGLFKVVDKRGETEFREFLNDILIEVAENKIA